uniref:Uncharacterized protein n=1 Tax=Rangifer tarandus platyrhynchus TaxID=3082113 RepID=A0ACB0F4I2_RANTA|nr:unnamed protein product [Rangifer tarandus platyrhynchus]
MCLHVPVSYRRGSAGTFTMEETCALLSRVQQQAFQCHHVLVLPESSLRFHVEERAESTQAPSLRPGRRPQASLCAQAVLSLQIRLGTAFPRVGDGGSSCLGPQRPQGQGHRPVTARAPVGALRVESLGCALRSQLLSPGLARLLITGVLGGYGVVARVTQMKHRAPGTSANPPVTEWGRSGVRSQEPRGPSWQLSRGLTGVCAACRARGDG